MIKYPKSGEDTAKGQPRPAESWRGKKAELHVHLEGTVTGELLRTLADRNGVDLTAPTIFPGFPPIPAPSLLTPFQGNFLEFISLYVKISQAIKERRDIEDIARAYLSVAKEEEIVAADIYVTPTTLTALGCSEAELAAGLLLAQNLAAQAGVRFTWIFDIVRNGRFPGEATVEIATRLRDQGVAVNSIGLAGLEAGYPASPFRYAFKLAHDRGFKVVTHAGETAGPESIWETIEVASPTRIGHGITAINETKLIEELKRREITLELSPWSNILLKNSAPEEHPLVKLISAGVDVVLASDDPGIFGRSLNDNYLWASEHGVDDLTLSQIAERSLMLAASI